MAVQPFAEKDVEWVASHILAAHMGKFEQGMVTPWVCHLHVCSLESSAFPSRFLCTLSQRYMEWKFQHHTPNMASGWPNEAGLECLQRIHGFFKACHLDRLRGACQMPMLGKTIGDASKLLPKFLSCHRIKCYHLSLQFNWLLSIATDDREQFQCKYSLK